MRTDSFNKNILHTDSLQAKFGKIEVEVLHDDDYRREVFLKDQSGIVRTYAVTCKNQKTIQDPQVRLVNKLIKEGMGIGKAFRQYGIDIIRKEIRSCIIKTPEWLKNAFNEPEDFVKCSLIDFRICIDTAYHSYGLIQEFYSPVHFKYAFCYENPLIKLSEILSLESR